MIVRWLSAYGKVARFTVAEELEYELTADYNKYVCGAYLSVDSLELARRSPFGIWYSEKALIKSYPTDLCSFFWTPKNSKALRHSGKYANRGHLHAEKEKAVGCYHNEVWLRKGCFVKGIIVPCDIKGSTPNLNIKTTRRFSKDIRGHGPFDYLKAAKERGFTKVRLIDPSKLYYYNSKLEYIDLPISNFC